MATGEAIVKKALDRLKSVLSSEDDRMFSNTSLEDIMREARKIESEQGPRLGLKNLRRIEPFLRFLESYAGVIEVFCQAYAPMAFVWGPIKLILQLASNYTTALEKILQAFSELADALPHLDRLQTLFREDTHVNYALALVYNDITEFIQQAYKIFRRKAWHVWFTVSWGLFERNFRKIVERLSLHCDLLDKEAAAAHYLEMRKLKDKHQAEEDAFEIKTCNEMTRDVLQWLSAGEDRQEERLDRISDVCQSEACDWVLEDPQVRLWIQDDCGDAILWMTGIPGAGKSYLCSMIIRNLQIEPHRSTLYYFCSHQESSEDTYANLLRTLAFQLLQQNLDMALLVHQEFFLKGSSLSGPAVRKLLSQTLLATKVTRIVVDGIDELDRGTQHDILKSLVEIQKSAKNNCKLLICSREEPQIQKLLPGRVHMKLGNKTSEGLGLYINTQVKEELQEKFPEMDSSLVNLVEQRLHSKARGMFLWVRLVINTLKQQFSEMDIEVAIDQLPEGLNEAYGLVITRIDAVRPTSLRDRIFTILFWVCAAYRSIGIHEVADGLALHSGQRELNRRTRSNNLHRDIIELCAPLLESSDTKVLDLVHFSAKEYFVSEQSGPFVDISRAHLSIASSCVINLTTCLDVVPGYNADFRQEDLESRTVQGCYGLQSYGHEFWAEHVLAFLGTTGATDPTANDLLCKLEGLFRVWKHPTQAAGNCSSETDRAEVSQGLLRLQQSPLLYQFISSWLSFKRKLKEAKRDFKDLNDQQQWRMEADETYLSLIDVRLSTVTERLLTLESSQLPPHIDERDLRYFRGRFSFPCRFLDCHHCYNSVGDRDVHEASHVPSFPCLQCDFSGRGFRTRKDLEKHTKRYHMCPEDFDIPIDLQSCKGWEPGAGGPISRPNQTGRWTEQGRKALQEGFRHVLANVESEMRTLKNSRQDSPELTSKGSNPSASSAIIEDNSVTRLDNIRDKIERKQYDTLAEFKNDLRGLPSDSIPSSKWAGPEGIDSNCEGALEKALLPFPAFAHFDSTDLKGERPHIPFGTAPHMLEGQIGSLGELEKDMANLDVTPLYARIPYWSLTEKKKFPELLQRFGRDFSKIADMLKTKTLEDVEQYFVQQVDTGNPEVSDWINLAEARLQQEAFSTATTTRPREAESEEQAQKDHPHPTVSNPLQLSQLPVSSMYLPQFGKPKSLLAPARDASNSTGPDLESGETVLVPKGKKRRPPPRVHCPHCSAPKQEGFRDEYALGKHIERYHTATRKIWICEDISFDKKFLANCKACSASKRYSSKSTARKHLREVHFTSETAGEKLQRWLRETEEPNRNMQTSSGGPESRPSAPTTKRKRQETNISLPPLKDHRDSSRTLPSMILKMSGRKRSKSVSSPKDLLDNDEDLDEDTDIDMEDPSLSSPEDDSSKDDIFLDGVSFDNLLPGSVSDRGSLNADGPPHRTNRALIQLDQVSRLPNLNSFQKSACADHVEMLHYKLDKLSVDDSVYQETLGKLTSLSRSLMADLRKWQRRSTLAPTLPVAF